MKNMTLAFLACLTLSAPALAESNMIDQTPQTHHLNTKDVYNGTKTATPAAAPRLQGNNSMAPMNPAMPNSGNADADFASGMIAHHQSGVDMAKAELTNGKDPEMKRLAQSIVDSQNKEIAQMQTWLAKHK